MKNILVSIALVFVSFSASISAAVLYKDSNYRGGAMGAGPGDLSKNLGSLNDRWSSARVSERECLVLFEHGNFGGRWLFLGEGNYPQLSHYNFNDKASGYIVFDSYAGGCSESEVVVVYEHSRLRGRKYIAPPGISIREVGHFNDDASSVKVPAGQCIEMYEHANLSGRHFTYDRPGVNELNNWFNDDASSWRASYEFFPGICPGPSF